jgi:hypothetical protein
LFGAPAAGADTTLPGSYHAKATSVALQLSIFGQGISLGFAHAENASDPIAVARGIGALIPNLGNQQDQTATVNADGTTDTKPEACGPISLPANFPVVALATACSSATALVANGFPSSEGNAAVATIDVNGSDVLTALGGQLNPVIGQLLDGLKPIFGAVDQTGIDSESLLSDILAAITQDGDLVRIALGPSKSTSSADAAIETATASAQGAVIEVLPRDLLELDPVITIEVGSAANTINVDRNAGTATVDYAPSLVKVTLAKDIATALNLTDEQRVVSVGPGPDPLCLLPAPLTSCISVASGSQGVTPEGITHAEASGVSLQLLTGVQNGITLNLAGTAVEGVGALDTTRDAPPPPPDVSLPRTGGTTDTLLAGSLFALAVGGLTILKISRRRIFVP